MNTYLVVLLFGALSAAAQSVRLIPNLAVAETEYRDAQEAWLKNDPNLEADLYKANPAEVHKRIQRAAALRDDVMSKKAVYLDFLVKRFDEISARLANVKTGTLPVKQMRDDLEREQTRLLSEQERVEALLNEIPPGDEYTLVRRATEAEKADLVLLQNNVAMRIRSLDRIDQSQQSAEQVDTLAQRIEELRKTWEDEKANAIRARAGWAKYYHDLDHSVDEADPSKRAKTSRDVPAKPPAPAPFSGTWVYKSLPGGWNGSGEPLAVLLQIQTTGSRVEGVYSARLPGTTGIRDVTFTLTGQMISPTHASLKWTSDKPASHGQIELDLGPDGRISVNRVKSEDATVPLGTEVLSPK